MLPEERFIIAPNSYANRKCDGVKASDGHYVNGYAIGNGSWFDDEEGNILTPCTSHNIDPVTKKCKYCGIAVDSKYMDANQREQYAYEFIHVDSANIKRYLQDRFFGGNREMKFDIVIGNPPYQLDTKKETTEKGNPPSMPIYQLFFKQAVALNPQYISMIVPSKWFAGGMSILDEFRKYMMSCGKIVSLTDFSNAKDCFPSNSVAGGVCYFLWSRDYNGKCSFTNVVNNSLHTTLRSLNEFPVLVRNNKAVDILDKIRKFKETNMVDLGSSTMPFGIKSDVRGTKTKEDENDIELIASKDVTYIKKTEIKKSLDYLDKYKVLVGILGAEHALEPDKDGRFRIITSSMRVIGPATACTQSYFLIGKFDNKREADNLCSYLKTKFSRFLILLAMSSTHLSRSVLVFLPKQNFNETWTDEKLYKKYNLTTEEITYIDSMIKEMK